MRTRTRAGCGAVIVGLLSSLLTGTASAEPLPGSPGLGDPIYKWAGNGGYTVDHYDIDLLYHPTTDKLSGLTTIQAVTTQDLSQFNLDFALDVTSVQVGGEPATFGQHPENKTELVVTPKRPVPAHQPMEVEVEYEGTPSQVRLDNVQVWYHTATGAIVTGQPRNCRAWYPCNDHPSDKATYTVSASVPNGNTVVSNGILAERTQPVPGWTAWRWRADEPMVSYLAFIALGKFQFEAGTTAQGLPYYNAFDPALGDLLPTAKAAIQRTPEVTDFLATKFGPYPFGSTGGVATNAWPAAIEHQTRPVYGNQFWDDPDPTWVVAHEAAHQWFGDSVAMQNWSNMWLNEGFATYGEWLWSEHQGKATAAQLADGFYAKYPEQDPFWKLVLWPGTRLFDTPVYERGAMTLHALRTEVGDAVFFRILQSYHAKHRDGHATTEQFVQHASQVAGRPLDTLFKTWLGTPAKPSVGPNGKAVTATATNLPGFQEMTELHKQFAAHSH
nr:M1 family metallopeptidase [Kibdelosporangium sp. MJ126-NF4]CEL13143.1 putative metallopeptidase [Kibdelosporangium sp. MJ126-NF4]CTQ98831.1 putative metallopeptidase [Kibdelosporangium sp. MJ126-NF4]